MNNYVHLIVLNFLQKNDIRISFQSKNDNMEYTHCSYSTHFGLNPDCCRHFLSLRYRFKALISFFLPPGSWISLVHDIGCSANDASTPGKPICTFTSAGLGAILFNAKLIKHLVYRESMKNHKITEING